MSLVSILIPTYNRAEYLAECIDSCLMQSYKNIEIVVYSDGCTDSTPMLMDYYAAKYNRIKFVRGVGNKGIAAARNAALKHATGEYVAVMDSDDIMNPDRIKTQLQALKKANADVVYSSFIQADENGKMFGVCDPGEKVTREELLKEQVVPHVTILAKKKCFEDTPYREEFTANDDYGLIVDWFKAGYVFKKVKDPMVIVRYHPTNISKEKKELIESITEKLHAELAQ